MLTGMITVVILPGRKFFVRDYKFLFSQSNHLLHSEDDGSLARPPMHLFGRPRVRRSTILEDERVESELSGSDGSNNAGLEDGHSSDDQWFGGGPGESSAGGMVEDYLVDDDLD